MVSLCRSDLRVHEQLLSPIPAVTQEQRHIANVCLQHTHACMHTDTTGCIGKKRKRRKKEVGGAYGLKRGSTKKQNQKYLLPFCERKLQIKMTVCQQVTMCVVIQSSHTKTFPANYHDAVGRPSALISAHLHWHRPCMHCKAVQTASQNPIYNLSRFKRDGSVVI